jgi:hypothetical protein
MKVAVLRIVLGDMPPTCQDGFQETGDSSLKGKFNLYRLAPGSLSILI